MTAKEAVETLNKYRNQNYNSTNKDEVELANAINVILPNYVKQEKLLKLSDKLAEHRLIVIHRLLDEITDLEHFDTTKEFIDYIMYEAKYYGEEDTKIDEEIKKIKEIENDKKNYIIFD